MEKVMAATIPTPLQETNFLWLGERYVGKVRDSYVRDNTRVLIATDRLSAFDRVITTVPGKGQVLTQLAKFWFDRCASVVENHVIDVPDPCVMISREVSIVPVEVVVRGYVAGSAWRDYVAGNPVSGVTLPGGLREFERLSQPIVTPSTKEAFGKHDMPISESEIVSRGIVTASLWEQIRETALQLFAVGTKDLEGRGLLFADTKYEFGVLDDRLVLADEIHTLDSSRFWVASSYEERLEKGESPEMLDKEPIRRWLMDRGFKGDGPLPVIPDDYRMELVRHYTKSFQMITGLECVIDTSDPVTRIEKNLQAYFESATSSKK
jgi:phosphoribosylaminoimidazole-succinocarboxamide synthase